MQWTTDPGTPWVAVYRVIVLLLLLLNGLLIARGHQAVRDQVERVATEVQGVRTP